MNKLNNIDEKQLDFLLKEVYLDANSSNSNEQEANFIFNKTYMTPFNPQKEKELLQKLFENSLNKKNNQFLFLMLFLLTLLLGIVAYFCFFKDKEHTPIVNQTILTIAENNGNFKRLDNELPIESRSIKQIKEQDTFPKCKTIPLVFRHDSVDKSHSKEKVVNQVITNQALPLVTKKDKINYAELKEQLLRNLLTGNKNFYTKIPANKINYAGKALIVNGFTMRNMAVSNLEYKIFLADLISQNRTQDYYKAQVFSEAWSKVNCNQLADNYFSNHIFNDFPVVTVSREGVMLFCEWLQEEIELYIIHNKLKITGIKIRLPYSEEWTCAVRDGYVKLPFENGYNTMYDNTEGLIDKSFNNRQEKIKNKNRLTDSLYSYMIVNHYYSEEATILRNLNKGLTYFSNTEIDTLNPTKMKSFNKLYKVSEIVINKNKELCWLSGQTWKNKTDYKKFEQAFNLNACSPFAGFRFVVINPNEPEYKNPFW